MIFTVNDLSGNSQRLGFTQPFFPKISKLNMLINSFLKKQQTTPLPKPTRTMIISLVLLNPHCFLFVHWAGRLLHPFHFPPSGWTKWNIIRTASFTECWLYTRHCSKHITRIVSLKIHNNPMREVLLLAPFYRWENWDAEMVINDQIINAGEWRYQLYLYQT